MKKNFFLSKGIEKFTDLQINNLAIIKGGAPTIIKEIYYPTSGGGKNCPDGMIWSDQLSKCVDRYEEAYSNYTRG
jgi:hypothetical protein